MNAPLTLDLDVDSLTAQALELPPALRELLAHRLWESLHAAEESDLDPDQVAEIERRMDDLDAGRVELLDGEQVLRDLRAKVTAVSR